MHFQEARLFKRLTTKELATMVGTYESKVCGWQTGTRIPTVQEKRALATALEMEPKEISYGVPPGGYRRRVVCKAGPTGRASAKAKRAAATVEVETQTAPGNGHAPYAADIIASVGPYRESNRKEPDPTPPAPEAFDKGTWAVLRRMIETIGVDEAIRRLMLAR